MVEKAQKAVRLAPAGQPVNPEPEPVQEPSQTVQPQEPAQQPTPQYLTAADLEAALTKFAKEFQSSTGKLEARINKRLQMLQKAGITATPDQVRQLVEAEPEEQPEQSPAQGTVKPAQAKQSAAQALDLTTRAAEMMAEDGIDDPTDADRDAYNLMAAAGMRITDDDPEAKDLAKARSPEEFRAGLIAALAAKAARTQKRGSPSRLPTLGGSGAPSSKPAHAGMTGAETIDLYVKQRFGSG